MKVVILGAGQVGSTLAENLSQDHDVTVLDIDAERLLMLQSRLDIRTVQGSSSSPKALEDAGVQDADMLIAVTSNDESNILACQIAHSLFKVPTKIARVRNREITAYPHLFTPENIPVDLVINPAQLVTEHLVRLIAHPGTQLVWDFASGAAKIAGIEALPRSELIGRQVKEFLHDLADVNAKLVAICRNERTFFPESDTIIAAHDLLIFIAAADDVNTVSKVLLQEEPRYRRIMLAGAGNIGIQLAEILEGKHSVKLLDHSPRQTEIAAQALSKTVVLTGDASDADLLISENIDETDLFCSVTNDDEDNIMSAIVAKRLGAKHTIALVNRQSYAYHLIERSPDIDMALSPQKVTGGRIMTCMYTGDISNVYIMPRGEAQAIELTLHGEAGTSKVVGRTIKELKLPSVMKVCAVVRQAVVLTPADDFILAEGDHVVIFLLDKTKMKEVEKKFLVTAEFIK